MSSASRVWLNCEYPTVLVAPVVASVADLVLPHAVRPPPARAIEAPAVLRSVVGVSKPLNTMFGSSSVRPLLVSGIPAT